MRKLAATHVKILRTLDAFQVVTLDVYLGGFVFYVLALIPLGLFARSSAFIVPGASFLLLFGFFVKKQLERRKDNYQSYIDKIKQVSRHKTEILMGSILILLFLIILFIEVEAAAGVIFGNIHDASLFSMLATVISQQGMIPATLSPFEPSGIIYPQGFSVILTFAAYVFAASPAEMILILTPLFQAFSTLGAYFLGKIWSGRMSYGLMFALIFTFVSRWPKLLVWGSYAFVAAFPLYLVVLGLIVSAIGSVQWTKRGHLFDLLFLGLIIGYLGAIHAVYYEVAIATLFTISIIKVISKRRRSFWGLLNSSIAFIFSLLPVGIFLYRFVASASMPAQNVGLPSDVKALSLFPLFENLKTLFGFFFGSDWISPYPVLEPLTVALIVSAFVITAVAWKSNWLNRLNDATKVILSSLLGAGFLIAIASNELGLSFLATITNPHETAILLFSSLLLMVGISQAIFCDRVYSSARAHLSKAVSLLVITLLFIQLLSPFIYYTLVSDMAYCQGIHGLFAVATSDDVELMVKMRNSLPSNSVVLINPYDAGGFISSVAGLRVIYPFTASRDSISYSNLCSLIVEGNLNESIYNFMRQLNITHVFVGSRAINYLGLRAWSPLLFLGNPNFELINKVGNSYLFAFTPSNSSLVFFDDFENRDPQHNGWEILSRGNGTFNVVLSSELPYRFEGNNSLALTTQTNSNLISLNWFQRMIYLPTQEGNTTLSFYLNSLAPFKDFEGLTFIVSDENWEHKLSIATWNRGDALRLSSPGFYELDLSSLWFTKYQASLPSRFYLQLELYDTDGIGDSFFIDSVGVSFRSYAVGSG